MKELSWLLKTIKTKTESTNDNRQQQPQKMDTSPALHKIKNNDQPNANEHTQKIRFDFVGLVLDLQQRNKRSIFFICFFFFSFHLIINNNKPNRHTKKKKTFIKINAIEFCEWITIVNLWDIELKSTNTRRKEREGIGRIVDCWHWKNFASVIYTVLNGNEKVIPL